MDTDPLGELTPEDAARGTTSFPMPLGQAAAFDPALVSAVAAAISDEARAKSNIYRNTTGTVRCAHLLQFFGRLADQRFPDSCHNAKKLASLASVVFSCLALPQLESC